jgi:hypothetical protein
LPSKSGHAIALAMQRCVRVLMVMVACPDCPAAREARAMFLDVDLLFNLAAVVLPFAVCAVIVLLLMRIGMMRARMP